MLKQLKPNVYNATFVNDYVCCIIDYKNNQNKLILSR